MLKTNLRTDSATRKSDIQQQTARKAIKELDNPNDIITGRQ